MTHELSPDTQAVLLLCGNLGQRGGTDLKPLGAKQYSAVAAWLSGEGMSPADLLTPEGVARLAAGAVAEVPHGRVEPLLDRGAAMALVVERWQRSGIWIISRADAAYPRRLETYLGASAPPLFCGVGSLKALGKGGLAIVGSRDRSDEDGAYARRIGEQCAREGIAVISGAAKGIDRDAMTGALESGGAVVGVLAEGVAKYALAAELREQIADGCLTLMGAYEPEMRWQTWIAMERNKILYGMSDAALVVTSGEESGGTWAGATEALRIGRIRVYVRTGEATPPGNARLLGMGGLPFPAEPLHGIADLLLPPAPPEPPAEPPPVQPEPEPIRAEAVPMAVRDAYTLVLPEILLVLSEPQEEKALAEAFQVRAGQMKDWLDRAIAEGKVVKTKRPVRYALPDAAAKPAAQVSLFEMGGPANEGPVTEVH